MIASLNLLRKFYFAMRILGMASYANMRAFYRTVLQTAGFGRSPTRTWKINLREKDSDLQSPDSKSGMLPVTPSRNKKPA